MFDAIKTMRRIIVSGLYTAFYSRRDTSRRPGVMVRYFLGSRREEPPRFGTLAPATRWRLVLSEIGRTPSGVSV